MMNISDTQVTTGCKAILENQFAVFKTQPKVTICNHVPDTSQIGLVDNTWKRIKGVICVFVDMIGSTKLSASEKPIITAKAYHFFTETAARIFHEYSSPYIDIKGDGVFGLFNCGQEHRALAAAVTFKTFVSEVFVPEMKNIVSDVELGAHIGIDQDDVLVKKLGLKKTADRQDRQNEVWAGKPINMACKLAGLAKKDELYASERFYRKLTHDRALLSCGCNSERVHPVNGVSERVSLWNPVELPKEGHFDFSTAHVLKSIWCKEHGKEYCQSLLNIA